MNRVRHTEIDKVRKREREEKRKETKKHSYIRMNNSSFHEFFLKIMKEEKRQNGGERETDKTEQNIEKIKRQRKIERNKQY